MPWIFGSFLVTPFALTSCHVVISKQESTIMAVGYNRCVTRRRLRDENHAVRFRQRQRIVVERGTRSRSEASLTSLQWGASVGTPWLQEEYMERSNLLSEYMSLHPSLAHHKNINPLVNKVWEIYFYEEVCSFAHGSS